MAYAKPNINCQYCNIGKPNIILAIIGQCCGANYSLEQVQTEWFWQSENRLTDLIY